MNMEKDTGNVLWTLLHAYAAQYPHVPDEAAQEGAWFYFSVFTSLVVEKSKHGCKRCDLEWQTILKICPPDLSSRDALYAWTIAAHDRINRKLGKQLYRPQLSLQHVLLTTP